MAAERPPAPPPSLAGMGNTITNNHTFPITLTSNPTNTNNPSSAVHNGQNTLHNVQPASTTHYAPAGTPREEKTSDVLSAGVHNAGADGTASNGAANQVRTSPPQHPPASDNASKSMHDVDMADDAMAVQPSTSTQHVDPVAPVHTQQSVSDRVPTPAHPIEKSYASVPPFPPSARASLFRADAAVSETDDAAFALKWITIRVNLRAHTSRYKGLALPITPSNNLTTLRRVMFRASENTGVTFSPRDIMQGLQHGRVQMRIMTKDDITQAHKTTAGQAGMGASAAAGDGIVHAPPTSSSSSLPLLEPDTIPTHQIVLRFDSNTNCKKGYQLLKQLQLSPRVPSQRYITGKVYGFPFTATNAEMEPHMQQNAWYEGGVPSIVITRSMQPAQHMFGEEQARDWCYFAVLASEFGKALHIPRINSTRPLYFEKYERSKTTVCYHCNRAGHTSNACAARARNNDVDGMRDACIMCGSFEHISKTCPTRDDPAAMCIICNKGKHTVRACPMYRGTYAKVACPQSRVQDRPSRNMRWAAVAGSTQQQRHVPQQRQQNQQQQVWKQKQPHTHDHNPQQDAMDSMREENKGLREQIASLLTTQVAMARQLQVLTETLTTFMAHIQTEVSASVKNTQPTITHVPATNATTPTATTNTHPQTQKLPLSKHAQTTANKGKAIAAVNGTPSLSSLWQPSVTAPVAKAAQPHDGGDEDETDTQGDIHMNDEDVLRRMADPEAAEDGASLMPGRKKSRTRKVNTGTTAAADKVTLNSQGKRPRSSSTHNEQ
jgi:hypothetical protein